MDVFVYGTLTAPRRVREVVDSFAFLGDAVCRGLGPVEGTYPTLAPGGETPGRLLRVADADRAALDRYEGVSDGLYVRETVPRSDGGDAAVYVGDPDRLGADATWPGDGPFPERVRRYLRGSEVVVAPVD
jgi:gamma-glutamylcyclotransferase (GGCT)/AIG2-like uncharacterized protein YtfP